MQFRKAIISEVPEIWEILAFAIQKRKEEGSSQWQDGYPNLTVIENDIENNYGYVLIENETIVGYCALIINDEPEYQNLKGKWLTNDEFLVFHRVAIHQDYLGKGLARKMMEFIECFALENKIFSIKADTNFDNLAMLSLFEKMNYHYCGEVHFRGSPRKAFEKVLEKT